MGFRFEFDPAHKILLTRIEGRFSDEVLRECEAETRKRVAATGARVHIVECSAISEFAVSAELVRQIAKLPPILSEPGALQFFVVPSTVGFGLARMFQISAERSQPSVIVMRKLDEVLAELGIQSPRFENLE